MRDEVRRILELSTMDDIDFITLKDEKDGVMCLFVSLSGSYKTLFIRKEPVMQELRAHAIANIIYGNQAVNMLLRLYKWMQV